MTRRRPLFIYCLYIITRFPLGYHGIQPRLARSSPSILLHRERTGWHGASGVRIGSLWLGNCTMGTSDSLAWQQSSISCENSSEPSCKAGESRHDDGLDIRGRISCTSRAIRMIHKLNTSYIFQRDAHGDDVWEDPFLCADPTFSGLAPVFVSCHSSLARDMEPSICHQLVLYLVMPTILGMDTKSDTGEPMRFKFTDFPILTLRHLCKHRHIARKAR